LEIASKPVPLTIKILMRTITRMATAIISQGRISVTAEPSFLLFVLMDKKEKRY
jgi:hypothetical protein